MANVGRNDPCPCGSGKKYKRCCLGRSKPPPNKAPGGSLPEQIKAAFKHGCTGSAAVDAAIVGITAMDQGLSIAWSRAATPPACTRGCSYCCSVRVSVTVPELMLALAFAREKLPTEELRRVRERARENASRTHGTTPLGYPLVDCAFLSEDGACRVYEARPLACRREHSLDAGDCKSGYENYEPGKDFPISHDVRAMLLADMTWDSYVNALRAVGVDATQYELQEALHIALSDPKAIATWLDGERTFEPARVNETVDAGMIPPQLVELRTRKPPTA